MVVENRGNDWTEFLSSLLQLITSREVNSSCSQDVSDLSHLVHAKSQRMHQRDSFVNVEGACVRDTGCVGIVSNFCDLLLRLHIDSMYQISQ